MTVSDAARVALEKLARPATVDEILQKIQEQGLYEFKAKDPRGVLSSALRSRSAGSPSLRGEPIFRRDSAAKYSLS